jgi:hypothetical protein
VVIWYDLLKTLNQNLVTLYLGHNNAVFQIILTLLVGAKRSTTIFWSDFVTQYLIVVV